MKVIALPRDPNPYQRLLYEQFGAAGNRVRYGGELTPSATLNLLLLPLELAVCRLRGWDVLHLHWVFAFKLTGSDRLPALRRLAQAWFRFALAVIRALGFRLVWTAHNALPHDPVFADELAARRQLVAACDLVIVHSSAMLRALSELGLRPRRSIHAPHGPLSPGLDLGVLRPPGSSALPRMLLCFGQLRAYKGVEDLLEATALVPDSVAVRVLVAGQCDDVHLAGRLRVLGARCGERVQLRLEWIPEAELTRLLASADAVALPLRRMATSGSALLALGHGRPLILPVQPAFDDLPADAVFRYDGTVPGLARTIEAVACAEPERLRRAGRAAAAYAATLSWEDAAARTMEAIESLPRRGPRPGPPVDAGTPGGW